MKTITPRQIQAVLFPILLFILFFAGMAAIQFATPNMPDNDGFYHIKFAWLMRMEGLKPNFPWLPLSILNPREFYDHHFLFHIALIPFTFGDLRIGAKWAAVTFASLAFFAIWLLLYRQRVPLAWLWAIGLLGISEAFLFRMSITRAQSLSLGFLALAFLWLLEGKYKWLGILAFLYVWMYDAFPLIMALAFLYFLSVLIIEHRFEIRPLLFVGVGIALGMIVNPYFPHNITFFIEHVAPKLTDATSVNVGNEWYPYDTSQLLKNSLPALVAFISGALALGLSGRKMDLRTTFSFFSALLFGLMLFQARRFVEYFPPFALIFAAFAWLPLLADLYADTVERTESRLWSFLRSYAPAILLALLVVISTIKSIPVAQKEIRGSSPYNLYAGASLWLMQNTREGERVFQTDWDDFPRLFYFNTHNTYLVGLDPTYMQLYDGKLYNLWVQITRGNVAQPSKVIASRFGTRFILTDLNHGDFIRQAENDPGLKEVYRDNQAIIFEVIAPPDVGGTTP